MKKILEAMEYMDQKYIDEAVNATPKKRSYQPFIRWGAVAACLVLVISLSVGYFGGYFTQPGNEMILPPTRYGAYQISSSLNREYTLQEGFAHADAVAWIRIENWLAEDTDNHPIGKTYFEAKVIECYKGKLPETFVLKQFGSTKGTNKQAPLFTYGNELLLFLKVDAQGAYADCYYILGSYGTVMDVITSDDGTVYVSDRIGSIGQALEKTTKNYGESDAIKTKLASAVKNDEIQRQIVAHSNYLFTLTDIQKQLMG